MINVLNTVLNVVLIFSHQDYTPEWSITSSKASLVTEGAPPVEKAKTLV